MDLLVLFRCTIIGINQVPQIVGRLIPCHRLQSHQDLLITVKEGLPQALRVIEIERNEIAGVQSRHNHFHPCTTMQQCTHQAEI